jgi:DegV family protein with EDD domain
MQEKQMEYRIISDSGCDLTPELKNELNVETVPFFMTLGSTTYKDDENLDIDNFLDEMRRHKELPKSSCPSPFDFIEKSEKGKVNFIVTLSSRLSGSYNSALIAKDMLNDKGIEAHVFDSKSASAGQSLVVKMLRDLASTEQDKTDIIKKLEDFIKNLKTFFVLENFENLLKNGRMNKVTGLIASVMNIRLIMAGNEHGEIVLNSKAKGSHNSLAKLAEIIGENCKDTADKILTISHCHNSNIDLFRKMVKEKYSFKDIIVSTTRGLTGMYANYGGIVIGFNMNKTLKSLEY